MTEPTPFLPDDTCTLHVGDCLDVLPHLPDASVDAIVTDPPYEIGIADQGWDRTGIAYSVPMWAECLRVLKPGGHLLSFGSPRTFHRMAVAAEDAGFRIIDQIDWIYTNGKPNGIDLSRAIDRRRDDREQVLQVTAWLSAQTKEAGWSVGRLNTLFGFHIRGQATHWVTQGVAAVIPTIDQWNRLREAIGFDDTSIRSVLEALWVRKGTVDEAFSCREVISESREAPRAGGLYPGLSGKRVKAKAATDEARRWEGWSTSLRPAHDPILLARKGTGFDTLTANVLRRGVGGLNVAACPASGGGWPANIVLGHDCPDDRCLPGCPVREMGAAQRSFPVFKLNSRTPAAERLEVNGVRHDTPKPLALMRWLVRLVCPPEGVVLDPFAGSGTTLEAAALEGFRSVGVEQHLPYAEICRVRLSKPREQTLFGEIA